MPSIRFRLIALILCVCDLICCGSAQAEPEWVDETYLLDRWTNADGLPVNGTTDVHLGKRGYLWLATFDGLVRFDGYRFETFNASSHPGLPGNRLTRLVQQNDGLIWVLTEQYALASFDGRRFHPAGIEQGLPAERVLKLHQDASDRLWLGTERGLARACGRSCFRIIKHESLDGEAVQAFAEGPEGVIWAGTGSGGVVRLDVDGVRLALDAAAGLELRDVRAMAAEQGSVVWAGGQGGLARIENGRARMLAAFDDEVINDLEITPEGDLIVQAYERTWRSSDGEWQVVNEGPIAGYVRLAGTGPQGSSWRVRQNELLRDGEPVVRAPCPIKDFDFDATGRAWLATLCDGLWRIRKRDFDTITEQHGLPEGPVYGMAQGADGRLWASVGAGLMVEIAGGVVERIHDAGFSGQVLGTVAIDDDGRVWAGKGGLCIISGNEQCITPSHLPEALRNVLVRSIFEDRGGDLWVGSQTGLWRHENGQWRNMQVELELPEWVQVQVALQARSGNLWFGTDSSGLRRRSGDGDVVVLGSEAGLASDRIRDLHQDKDGRLWVVTADSGVCRSDRTEDESGIRFDCLDTGQGLYADSLHRLLTDDHGRFWFNSNSGVFWVHGGALERVLDGRSERVYPRVYTEKDGLPDREGNGGVQNAGIRLSDGRLAFPGQGGIAIFDPDRVRARQGVPRVIIEQLRLADGASLPAGEAIRLPLGERVFSVQLTGIKPGLTGQTYFRYRFDGAPWVEVGADRNLGFDSVLPGRHRLEVAAVDADSGLSGPITSMQIIVPPHIHERTDVRLGLAGMLALIVALWLMRRHRAAVRLKQYLHREVERRTVEALRQQRRADAALSSSRMPEEAGDGPNEYTVVEEPLLADDVRVWVDQNVQQGSLSVAALAEALHMSRSKLHRRLVEETGLSPGEFIREVRLGIGRQMLQDNGKSVSDVAYAIGFSSVSSFSRAYRSHFGESPSRATS